jgi:hypothetical protein
MLRTLMVDGGVDVPCPSLGGSEDNHYRMLCLEHGLAVM